MSWVGLLQVVLIVLKLIGAITISWWLVFLPTYGLVAWVLFLFAAMILAALYVTNT